MALETSKMEAQARQILKDAVSPYRWSSSEIRTALRDAVRHLHSIRPESRYIDGKLTDFDLSEDDSSVNVDSRWEEAIVYYAVYRCYLVDDSDTVNQQLAEAYLARAEKWMQL